VLCCLFDADRSACMYVCVTLGVGEHVAST
jgi:hypothetical protein